MKKPVAVPYLNWSKKNREQAEKEKSHEVHPHNPRPPVNAAAVRR